MSALLKLSLALVALILLSCSPENDNSFVKLVEAKPSNSIKPRSPPPPKRRPPPPPPKRRPPPPPPKRRPPPPHKRRHPTLPSPPTSPTPSFPSSSPSPPSNSPSPPRSLPPPLSSPPSPSPSPQPTPPSTPISNPSPIVDAPPLTNSPPSTPALTTEQQAWLNAHNPSRSLVGSPDLTWNAEAAAFAQSWVNHLASLGCGLSHSQNRTYGENLSYTCCSAPSISLAVSLWVNEGKLYSRAIFSGGCSTGNWEDCGHYTQVVWKGSTSVGCAYATCSGGKTVYSCNYYPPGNVIGQYPY